MGEGLISLETLKREVHLSHPLILPPTCSQDATEWVQGYRKPRLTGALIGVMQLWMWVDTGLGLWAFKQWHFNSVIVNISIKSYV